MFGKTLKRISPKRTMHPLSARAPVKLTARRKWLVRGSLAAASMAVDPTGTSTTALQARAGTKFIPKAGAVHGIDTWLPMEGLGRMPPAPGIMTRQQAWAQMNRLRPIPASIRRGLRGIGAFDLSATGKALVGAVKGVSLPIKQETYKGWDIYLIVTGEGADGKPAGKYTAVKAGSPGPSVGAGGFESDVTSILDIRENIDKYGTPYPPAEAAMGMPKMNWTPWIIGGAATAGVLLFILMKRRG